MDKKEIDATYERVKKLRQKRRWYKNIVKLRKIQNTKKA